MIKHEYSKALPSIPALSDLQRLVNDAADLGVPQEARISFSSNFNSQSLTFIARWETITE